MQCWIRDYNPYMTNCPTIDTHINIKPRECMRLIADVIAMKHNP